MRLDEYEGDDAERFVVVCEDCELSETYDENDPPPHVIDYWESETQARRQWSALSAAKGKRDDHNASTFVDYENGIRHSAHIEVLK